MLITGLQKLVGALLQAVSDTVLDVDVDTTMDCVVSPPGLQEYEVGLLVQFAVNVTGVPGATGAAAVAGGEALIVHIGCCAIADPQPSNRLAMAKSFANDW